MVTSGRVRAIATTAVALFAAAPITAYAQDLPSGGAGEEFAIEDVRVFDGTRTIEGATVLVRDGRIEDVGTAVTVPEGLATVDGTGRTLLPGLIDAHTHTFLEENLRLALLFGVTTELDQFTDAAFAAGLRTEQQAGDVTERADLFSAGTLATAAGGHGTEYGLTIPTLASPEEARAFVRARREEGSDWIKIVWEDGSTYGMRTPTLDSATVHALVDAAHEEGMTAMVHVATRDHARTVAAMGADGIVHAPHDGPPAGDLGAQIAGRGTSMTPTLSVVGSIANTGGGRALLEDPALEPWLTPDAAAALQYSFPANERTRRAAEHAAEVTRQVHDEGGRVLAGTDVGNPGTAHGISMHGELADLVAAGLTPAEALTAATSAPAEVYGLEDRGRIAPGLRADLVLVEGDPTVDIRRTRSIVGVWRNGVPVDRDAARAMVAELRRVASAPLPIPGPVSDFDGGELTSEFGVGWGISTDAMVGGASQATITPREGALVVDAQVVAGGPSAWAGAMWYPGSAPMVPADISAAEGISFRVRGMPGTYSVMIFATSLGQIGSARSFQVEEAWSEVRMDFADFARLDPSGTLGIFIGVSGRAGPFTVELDDVALY